VFRKAFLGPLYKEVEYLAKLEQQAKEAGHKRWDYRIKIHRSGSSYRHRLFRLVPAKLVQKAKEVGP
jgi:hypothetical protein